MTLSVSFFIHICFVYSVELFFFLFFFLWYYDMALALCSWMDESHDYLAHILGSCCIFWVDFCSLYLEVFER